MRIFLKKGMDNDKDIAGDGIALGFGIGLVTQIFTGLSLIGAGAGLMFQGFGMQMNAGTVQSETAELVANASFISLLTALLSMILYRVAMLTVSSVQGYLVAVSMKDKPIRFWSALLIATAFSWLIFLIQWMLGTQNPGQLLGITSPTISIISIAYYLLIFYSGYYWLAKELKVTKKKKFKKGEK
jgi:hypothetical protein